MSGLGDLPGTVIPEEYGGEDMGWLAAMVVTEEIAKGSSSLRVQVNMQVLGCAYTIFRYGTEAAKKRYIEKLCTAEYLGGFGITEADAGSDVMAMSTTAEDKGDHYLLNGSKTWISNAAIADALICYAYTDKEKGIRGLSAFVIEPKKLWGNQHHGPGETRFPFLPHGRGVSGQCEGAQREPVGQPRRRCKNFVRVLELHPAVRGRRRCGACPGLPG